MYLFIYMYTTYILYILHYGQGLKPKSVLDLRPNYCTRSVNERERRYVDGDIERDENRQVKFL